MPAARFAGVRPSGSTGCTLTGSSASSTNNSINAPITVSGVVEYQTSIRISGLTSGHSYCYRIYTGGSASVDLLGTDPAPRFKHPADQRRLHLRRAR